MLYKPISGLVNVGYSTYAERFCWEDESRNCHHAPQTLEHLADALRRLDVEPLQIENTGTEKPYKSKKLSKKRLKELKEYLSNPYTYVIKLEPAPTESRFISLDGSAESKFPEKTRPKIYSIKAGSSIFIDHPFLVVRGNFHYSSPLYRVPALLRRLEVKAKDILFREERNGKFLPADYKEKYYVLLSRHRKKKTKIN